MDGTVPLTNTSTHSTTLSLCTKGTDAYQEERQHLETEVLHASLARTVRVIAKEDSAGVCRVSGDPVYRVSGVGQGSAEPESQTKQKQEGSHST